MVPQRSHHRMAPPAHGPTPHVAPPTHCPMCGPHQRARSHIHMALHVNMDPPLRSHMWALPALDPTCGPHKRIVPHVGPTSAWSHVWAPPALGPTCGPHQRWVPQTQGSTPHLDPTNARSHATYGPTGTWSHKWAPLGPTCEPKFSKKCCGIRIRTWVAGTPTNYPNHYTTSGYVFLLLNILYYPLFNTWAQISGDAQ
jgi:hypothetical protein